MCHNYKLYFYLKSNVSIISDSDALRDKDEKDVDNVVTNLHVTV